MLSVARMLSLHGTRHVRPPSHAEIVALPLPPATPSGLPPETSGCPAVCAWSRLAEARAVAPADAHARRHAARADAPGSLPLKTPYACHTSPATYPHSHTGSKAAASGSPRQTDRAGRSRPP